MGRGGQNKQPAPGFSRLGIPVEGGRKSPWQAPSAGCGVHARRYGGCKRVTVGWEAPPVASRTPRLMAPALPFPQVPCPFPFPEFASSPPRASARSHARSYSLFLCLRTLTSRDREERSDSGVKRGRGPGSGQDSRDSVRGPGRAGGGEGDVQRRGERGGGAFQPF